MKMRQKAMRRLFRLFNKIVLIGVLLILGFALASMMESIIGLIMCLLLPLVVLLTITFSKI